MLLHAIGLFILGYSFVLDWLYLFKQTFATKVLYVAYCFFLGMKLLIPLLGGSFSLANHVYDPEEER